jgi:hypothetical protein
MTFFFWTSDFGTAMTARVKLVRRSIGVSPRILIFIGSAFFGRAEVGALIF